MMRALSSRAVAAGLSGQCRRWRRRPAVNAVPPHLLVRRAAAALLRPDGTPRERQRRMTYILSLSIFLRLQNY
jgi:hypothetical protein